ncbi:response regulator [bacterium]|nr:response regulator [bacterium]
MRLEKILVVDDEPEVLLVLCKMLEEKGYKPIPCSNGAEAMEMICKERFYIGLIDIMLPDMDGIEILKESKKKNTLAEIIVITGHESIDLAIKAIKYQACDFLLKPINCDLLYNSVRKAEELAGLRLKNLAQTKRLERAFRKRTKQLIYAEKQAIIGSAVQGVVHNIINPLTVISGRAELLKSELNNMKQKGDVICGDSKTIHDPSNDVITPPYKADTHLIDKIVQDIDVICQNSQKIFQIVNNILKKSINEHQENPSRVDINSMVLQEIEFFKSDLFFKHQVKTSYHLDPAIGEVIIVHSHLSQVIDNLIKNAIEAMYDSSEKELIISTYQDDENIFISINDTGHGIPEHLKEKIFEQFFTTNEYKEGNKIRQCAGAGLGLYTCLEILRPYGAEIRVESQAGKGSTFTVALPRSLERPAATGAETIRSYRQLLENRAEKLKDVTAGHLC